MRSACWLSSVPHPRAKRNLSASSTACVRARYPGASFYSTSSVAVLRLHPSSQSLMARSAFRRPFQAVWPKTRGQRCWVHKTANVLNKLPKSQHPKAKQKLQEIWMAATKADALAAFYAFVEICCSNTTRRLSASSRIAMRLLAFYDFPAEHWKHLRTTNVIESTFATVRHRTARSKAAFPTRPRSRWSSSSLKMPRTSRRCLDGSNQLPKPILGVTLLYGIEVVRSQAQAAAA